MKIKKILFVFSIILAVFLIGIGNSNQKTMASLSDQQKESEAKIEEFKKKIGSLEGQIFDIMNEINSVEVAIADKENLINQLGAELAQKEVELEETNLRYETQKQTYYSHLRNKYEDGDVNFTEIILDSSNITDYINYNEYYRIVKEQEEKEVENIKATKAEIEVQKASIEENKVATENEKNQLATEKGKLDAVKSEYDSQKAELEGQLAAEEEARQSILQQIQDLVVQHPPATGEPNYGGNYTGSASLQWPVPSVSPSTTNVQRFSGGHKGFDIGGMTDPNRAIVAIDSGVVILAQSYYGYGNAVMINHGNGMVSLYGHLNSIGVSVGQSVSRGDRIGIMGNTGYSFGIHLHLEIIINGVSVNPEPYIR